MKAKEARKVYKIMGAVTIFLYIFGVFTGYALYHWAESKSSEEIQKLEGELEAFNSNLEKLQMEQLYLTSYQGEMGCQFLLSSINDAQADLDGFIHRLPAKLEVYEKYNQTDPAYETLKADYMRASLRVWLLTLSVTEKCETDMVPILFFYEADQESIEQGYTLDRLREENPNLRVFTIDLGLDDGVVDTIKDVYNITDAPALLIKEQVFKGNQGHGVLSVALGTN